MIAPVLWLFDELLSSIIPVAFGPPTVVNGSGCVGSASGSPTQPNDR